MDINSIISHCKSLSFYDLQDYAGRNFNIVYDYIKYNKGANPNDILVPSIFTCIAVDGRLESKEWDFIASFIGNHSYDEAFNKASEFNCVEAQDIVRKLANFFPTEIKEAYVKMCIAVLCVDDRVNSLESSFLYSLI